jgi:hypothetical protein
MKTRKLKDDCGQTMILTALSMTILLGFVGFAADVGIMLQTKRVMQTAADGAALAGAAELNWATFDGTTVPAAAIAGATKNGMTNGVGGGSVTINYPPVNGPHVGDSAFVEAIVSQNQPTFFMKLFNQSSITVSARAVAGLGNVNQGCIYVLNPTVANAMYLQGSFTVSAPSCGIVVDSEDPNALYFQGGAGTLTAKTIGVAGGDGGRTGDSSPTPQTGIPGGSDPLAYIVPPDPSTMTCTAPTGGTLTGAVPAGCYSGNVTLNNAVLTGTYVFTGNVTLSGSVTTGTGGETIDIVNGTLSEATNTYMNLVASTDSTNPYHGIAILQPAPNANTITFDFGSSSGLIDGDIYAPKAQLFLHDSGGDPAGGLQLITDLIVDTLNDQTATLSIQSYSQSNSSASPLKIPTLVE